MDGERRIFERFSARFPAKFKDTRGTYGMDVFLRDASASGASIITRGRMELNDPVTLEVKVPGGADPMVLKGTIVWSKPINAAMWNAGVRFTETNLMKMHRLFKFSSQA